MPYPFFDQILIFVRGGGDLGSGVIYRLHKAGFPVVLLEQPTPTFVRRTVSFGEAVYSDAIAIEGVTSRLVRGLDGISMAMHAGEVPVVVDPEGETLQMLTATVVIDARMEKRNAGTTLDDAPLVIALGPGYTAGVDCHAVIETNRGHDLGRVIWQGTAAADTGEPGTMAGQTHSRVLRAPAAGHVRAHAAIGDTIQEGHAIAEVAGQPVRAAFTGVLRGLIHRQVTVTPGMKIGDLDPRCERRACFTISDKSLAIGGGALEAVLSAEAVRRQLG
ncbi:MAG: EF2563 family selenium-dependent molybdenum hydroxylase system protein [Anaerolineae bacterium]|nr:EF2563 family selenium-dependent molybdenum hydroxylase system protein [Anaerolineae bacterium]